MGILLLEKSLCGCYIFKTAADMTVILLFYWILCGRRTGLGTSDSEIGKNKLNECSVCISNVIRTATKPDFYVETCIEKCNVNFGDRKCLQERGQCVIDLAGYYLSSNKTFAKCPEHCKYWQSQGLRTSCKIRCTDIVCREESLYCNPISVCNIVSKVCTADCKDRYSEFPCVERCASNCKSYVQVNESQRKSCANGKFGSKCEKTCPTTGGNSVCKGHNGDCSHGCETGFWENKYEKMLSTDSRKRVRFKSSGTCSSYNFLSSPKNIRKLGRNRQNFSGNSGFTTFSDEKSSSACVGSICTLETEKKLQYECREVQRGSLCGLGHNIKVTSSARIISFYVSATVLVVCLAIFLVISVVIWRKRNQLKKHSMGADVKLLCKAETQGYAGKLLQQFEKRLSTYSIGRIASYEEVDSQHLLLIVCFTATRLFEDASAAVRDKPEDCHAALLIFHLRREDSPALLSSKSQLSDQKFSKLAGIVDFLYALTPVESIYTCPKNEDSYKEVMDLIKEYVSKREASLTPLTGDKEADKTLTNQLYQDQNRKSGDTGSFQNTKPSDNAENLQNKQILSAKEIIVDEIYRRTLTPEVDTLPSDNAENLPESQILSAKETNVDEIDRRTLTPEADTLPSDNAENLPESQILSAKETNVDEINRRTEVDTLPSDNAENLPESQILSAKETNVDDTRSFTPEIG